MAFLLLTILPAGSMSRAAEAAESGASEEGQSATEKETDTADVIQNDTVPSGEEDAADAIQKDAVSPGEEDVADAIQNDAALSGETEVSETVGGAGALAGVPVLGNNNPYTGHTEGTPYVRRLDRDGNTVLFAYYDANGKFVNSDYLYRISVRDSTYSSNTLCIRFDWAPGENDYEFDVKAPKEIGNETAKQLIYHTIHLLPYAVAHRVLCYWFGQIAPTVIPGEDLSAGNTSGDISGYGSTNISVSGFSGTVDAFIQKYTAAAEAIPTDVEFHAYYLDSDCVKPADYQAYQDFITWTEKKIEIEEKEYYIAVRKLDGDGKPLTGVKFDVAINGDKKNTILIGTDSEGIAELDLGFFETKPYVSVRERPDWEYAKYYEVDTKWYGVGEGSGNIGVYDSQETARKNAFSKKHTWTNKAAPVAMSLKKVSKDSKVSEGNPNYSLKGAEYKVFQTKEAAEKAVSSRKFDQAIGTLTTKKDGTTDILRVEKYMEKDAGNRVSESGTTFYVVESKAPKNYRLSKKVESIQVFPRNNEKNPAVLVLEDAPVQGLVKTKLQKSSAGNTGRKLENATFILRYYPEDISKDLTYQDLQSKTPDKTRTRILATEKKDGEEILALIAEDLPLGYFTLEEIQAPQEYVLSEDLDQVRVNGNEAPIRLAFVMEVSGSAAKGYTYAGASFITDDGRRVSALKAGSSAGNEILFINERIRGDLELRKTEDNTDEPVEGAVFLIENLETGETHRIVTDKDGYAGTASSYQKHDENTGYYDDGRAYDATKAGIWFREDPEDPDAEDVKPNNGRGALISGEYRITELDGNGLQKEEPLEIHVHEDGMLYQVFDPERKDGKKELTDMHLPELKTQAMTTDPEKEDEEDREILLNGPDQTVYDICSYTNLRIDTDYTLVGTIMRKEKDGSVTPFRKPDGSTAVAKTEFHTKKTYERSRYEACGSEVVRFDGLDFTGCEGTDFVVYERLYLGKETEGDGILTGYPDSNNDVTFPLIHEDPEDRNQTVTVPWRRTPEIVHTTLLDGVTREHIAYADQTVTFIDYVKYAGLIPRSSEDKEKPYVIEGVLMDRSTGKPLLDENKEEIRGTTEFYPGETGEGIVEVKFTFHGDLLMTEGKTIVCFEYLYDSPEGEQLDSHEDITDEDQTVRFPKVGTKAADPVIREAGSNLRMVSVTDHINYENLVVSGADGGTQTYTVRGWLMNPDGTVAKIDGKEVKAETVFTPEQNKGSVDVDFPEFEVKLEEGRSEAEFEYVIFEEVYLNRKDPESGKTEQVLVGEHKDIRSKEQTVTGRMEPTTGDGTPVLPIAILLTVSGLGVVVLLLVKCRKDGSDEE